MMRPFLATVLVTVLVMLAAGRAVAQTTTTGSALPNGGTIAFNELKIHEDNNPDPVFPKITPDSLWHYFNLPHCQCGGQPGITPDATYHEGTFAYLIQETGGNGMANGMHAVQFWAGPDCSNVTTTGSPPADCTHLSESDISSVDTLILNTSRPNFQMFRYMVPNPTVMDCTTSPQQGNSTLWAAVDTDGNGQLDYFVSMQQATDTEPPPLPTSFTAQGGDGSIVISWKPPSDVSDVYAYQALCARADTMAAGLTSGVPTQRYQTAAGLCGATGAGTTIDLGSGQPVQASAEVTETAVASTSLPAGLANLDPAFLCGETLTPTDTGLRIGGLENGVPYVVVLLVEDKFQNAAGTFFTSTLTPQPSTDFWEDLHGRGSDVNGGLCLIAQTYGDDNPLTGALRGFRDQDLGGSSVGRWLVRAYYATLGKLGGLVHGSLALRIISGILLLPLVALALGWHWLSLPGLISVLIAMWLVRRHRRLMWRSIGLRIARRLGTRPVQLAAGLAILVVTGGLAHAGGNGYQPYWEDNQADQWNEQKAEEGPGAINWHVGLRIGPYTPDIDKQAGGSSPGPYRQMFGGARFTPMLDVDRFLWTRFGGQLGIGLSAGYMQKTAHTFSVDPTTGLTNYSERAADKNTFHLLPLELSATYRFTMLDDEYGIPVVPYVRAGLAYYVWWVSGTGGPGSGNFLSTAEVCKGDGMEPDCSQNKALGASFGVQASIGLAIRAERIDAAAATSMRASGLQHAGVYAELSLAQVNGFGSDSKLSVGDRTWFAGFDFEF